MVAVQRLAMIPPPPQAAVRPEDETGSWLELQDAEGRPLYRRGIENPIREDIEVVAEDAERPLTRVRAEERRGTFFVLVPDIAQARRIVLRTAPPGARLAAARALAAAGPSVHAFDLPGEEREDH